MNAAAKMIHQSNFFTGKLLDIRLSKPQILKIFLALSVLMSALAVVYVTNFHRITFAQIEKEEEHSHQLQMQWGQLQLEQASLSSPARVQKLAVERAGMVYPTDKQVMNLRLQ